MKTKFAILNDYRADFWESLAVVSLHLSDLSDLRVNVTFSFMCVTWIVRICGVTHSDGSAWIICVAQFIHMCDMNKSSEWHDLFVGVTWVIHTYDRPPSCLWHTSSLPVTRLIHLCDMTQSNERHDSFVHVTWRMHTYDRPPSYHWHKYQYLYSCTHDLCQRHEGGLPMIFFFLKIWGGFG